MIRAIAEWRRVPRSTEIYLGAGLWLNARQRNLTTMTGETTRLTVRDSDILWQLVTHLKQRQTPLQLAQGIAGSGGHPISEAGIKQSICRLRRKLYRLSGCHNLIYHLPGHGYILQSDDDAALP